MTEQIKAVAFVWSLSEEPSWLDFLDEQYGEYKIIPLHYAAWKTACSFVPKDKLVDISTLVPPEIRRDCLIEGDKSFNIIHEYSEQYLYEPWLKCFDLATLGSCCFYYHYWNKCIQNIYDRWGHVKILNYACFSRGALPGIQHVIMDILDVVINLNQNNYKTPSIAFLNGFIDNILNISGYILNLIPCRVRFDASSLKMLRQHEKQRKSVIISGLLESDRRAQAGLVEKLISKGFIDFTWLISINNFLSASKDEIFLENNVSSTMNNCCSVDLTKMNCKDSFALRIIRKHLWHRISRILINALSGEKKNRKIYYELAAILLRLNSHVVQMYKCVDKLFSWLSPKIVVVNSSVEIQRMVRAWCDKNHVEMWRLPHGVERQYINKGVWIGDRIFVMGEWDKQQLLKCRHELKDKIQCCGGVHLSKQMQFAKTKLQKTITPKIGKIKRICYLMTNSRLFCPDTFLEMEDDIFCLAQICKNNDATLWVRTHPRIHSSKKHNFISWQQDHLQKKIKWELSDSLSSLNKELQITDVAIIRSWNGVSINLLYAEVPIIGWLPRCGIPDSDDILEQLPLCIRTRDKMSEALCQLNDPKFKSQVVQKQNKLLRQMINNPDAPPFETISELMVNEFEVRFGNNENS